MRFNCQSDETIGLVIGSHDVASKGAQSLGWTLSWVPHLSALIAGSSLKIPRFPVQKSRRAIADTSAKFQILAIMCRAATASAAKECLLMVQPAG